MGGVTIPHETGLLGHSDADVLAHAVSDALLGAAALGDIGGFFPDNDPKYQDADSIELLRQVCVELYDRGYAIENIDATVIAQAPKLKPYIEQMRKNLAQACEINVNQISHNGRTSWFYGKKRRHCRTCSLLDNIIKTSLFGILCNKNKEVILYGQTPYHGKLNHICNEKQRDTEQKRL